MTIKLLLDLLVKAALLPVFIVIVYILGTIDMFTGGTASDSFTDWYFTFS